MFMRARVSQMTQKAIANHFLYLNENERDSGGTELAFHNH